MRRSLFLSLLLALSLLAPAVSRAAEATPNPNTTLNTFQVTANWPKPTRANIQSRALGLTITASVSASPGSAQPLPLESVRFSLPAGAALNGRAIPVCPQRVVEEQAECPRSTLVGTGEATAEALPDVEPTPATLSVYNGGPGKLFIAGHVNSPVNAEIVAPCAVSPTKAIAVDCSLPVIQTLPGEPPVSLTSITVKLTPRVITPPTPKHQRVRRRVAKPRPIAFLAAPPTCPRSGWPVTASFTFYGPSLEENALALSDTVDVTCRL